MSRAEIKKCLLLSYGPVPVPEQDKVEGGGLRVWGLAQGIQAQNKEIEVTVAYSREYEKHTSTAEFMGIKIRSWDKATIKGLIADYDTVIVSYCMGELSNEVARSIAPHQQLILDCYVPIYVEISARQSDNLEHEYNAFVHEVKNWDKVLRKGDLFLCANENQKRFYQGVLSALGRVNPATYEDDLILIVPYGVYRDTPKATEKPIEKMLAEKVAGSAVKKENVYKKLLWFGGIYPWFDIKTLINAVEIVNKEVPTKLIIVGAKNPFNGHPDFVKSYEELVSYVENSPVHRSNILMQDWVEFGDRANWYLDSDLVVLINKTGEENQLAWRTRLVDYIWADLPIITNAGDPLGEELIKHNAAAKLNDLTAEGLAKDISVTLKSTTKLKEIKRNIKSVREQYYWDVVTKDLAGHIVAHTRPTDIVKFGLVDVIGGANLSLSRRVIQKAKKLPKYYKNNGPRATFYTIRTMVTKRVGKLLPARGKRVVFIAHQLDTTGAPHVFIDAIKQFIKKHPKTPIEFHTFHPADKINIRELNRMGIKPKIYLNKDIGLMFAKGDVIVLNTVAFSDTLKDSVFDSLEKRVASKLIWYIHEDEPELIFGKKETQRIKRLLDDGKIIMYTAAVKTCDNYVRHFGNKKNIRLQMYRIKLETKRHKVRPAEDFEELRFILPGMMGDTRKGQLPIAYAFAEFKRRYYDVHPEQYRNFNLTYIGVGKDFPSRQLLKHTDKSLGDHFKALGPMPHEKCLDEVMKSNITICYSLRECLPMYVYEGMVAGHPILRNDSSGMEEQLEDGVNGFYIDSSDLEQVIGQIETVANKKKTSSSKLASMSKASHDITLPLEKIEYDDFVRAVSDAYQKG